MFFGNSKVTPSMRTQLFIAAALFLTFASMAQDNQKIMAPIHQLFDGMKKGDSAMVHQAFNPSPHFFTVLVDAKTNKPQLKVDDFHGFLKAIGTPHGEVWSEMIWSPKIEVDGNLAQVWVPYAFYAGKNFNHCGVDAFHLFRNEKGEWKIFHLVDTRQKEGCNIPKEVSDQFK
jgi:hypothetical protein